MRPKAMYIPTIQCDTQRNVTFDTYFSISTRRQHRTRVRSLIKPIQEVLQPERATLGGSCTGMPVARKDARWEVRDTAPS
jgi:hypothetical protein